MKGQCFRGLVKICGKYGILPNSYIIPESKAKKQGDSPAAYGGFSDVWLGKYGKHKLVAIKVLRYYESDDIRKIEKVKRLDRLPMPRESLTVYRTFAERS